MTTQPQHETHLDADQLSAFAAGALSAKERTLCLEHLAECALCREVTFLASAAELPEPQAAAPERRPARWSAFGWWPALSFTGAAVAAIVALAVLLHRVPNASPKPTQVAIVEPLPTTAAPLPLAPPAERSQPKRRALPAPVAANAPPSSNVIAGPTIEALPSEARSMLKASANNAVNADASTSKQIVINNLSLPVDSLSTAAAGMATAAPAAPRVGEPAFTLRTARQPSANGLAQLAGVITDASAASIPRATIVLDATSGAVHRQTTADNAGRFSLGSLPPGKYRLEIASPGFEKTVREIELSAGQLAQLDSRLNIGAASQTVEVSAAGMELSTSNADVADIVAAAKAVRSSITLGEDKDAVTLGLDGTGGLQHRKTGRRWKKVRGPWKNEAITALVLTADRQARVTTATGSWASADGHHWSPAK